MVTLFGHESWSHGTVMKKNGFFSVSLYYYVPKIVCKKTIITVSLILKVRVILVITLMDGHFSDYTNGRSF